MRHSTSQEEGWIGSGESIPFYFWWDVEGREIEIGEKSL
jgi:hypothetical protein